MSKVAAPPTPPMLQFCLLPIRDNGDQTQSYSRKEIKNTAPNLSLYHTSPHEPPISMKLFRGAILCRPQGLFLIHALRPLICASLNGSAHGSGSTFENTIFEVLAFNFLSSNLIFSLKITQLHFPMSLVPMCTMTT